jgi:hypothetical protein
MKESDFPRFAVQRLSRTSVASWRTLVTTSCPNRAQQSFLAQCSSLRKGCSVRIFDQYTSVVVAKETGPVQSALEHST